MRFADVPVETSQYESANVVIISAPHEATTSYGKGTATGPEAIIKASCYVELYNEVLDSEPYTVGIHTMPALKLAGLSHEAVNDAIYQAVDKVVKDGKFPIVLGGEHSISSAPVRAFDPSVTVLQYDAHTDLRDEYEGSKWSHASVMKRVVDRGHPTVAVGIRSLTKEEAVFCRETKRPVWYAHQLKGHWADDVVNALGKNVYITFDVDAWDPAIMPSTGTPEPNGMTWDMAVTSLEKVFASRKVVGFDAVELAPVDGVHGPDFMTAKLIYHVIGLYQKYQL